MKRNYLTIHIIGKLSRSDLKLLLFNFYKNRNHELRSAFCNKFLPINFFNFENVLKFFFVFTLYS